MAGPIPVIDCWSPILPSREIIEHAAHSFPEAMLGYLRVFRMRAMGLDEWRDAALRLVAGDAALLDAAGVAKTLVTGFDEATSAGGRSFVANEPVVALAARHPDRFIGRPSDLGHPRHFDAVACDFPDLKLILSHAGYPWVLEACLLAWKHPNVHLELAAHRPKHFTAPGAGWEPLLRRGQTTIQDEILYGAGAFLLGASPAELVREFQALPARREVMEEWCWRNAAALFGFAPSSLGAGPAAH